MNDIKHLFISLFLSLLIIPNSTFSQSCYPNGISLITQANVDNFLVNNPSCTVVQGDVCIGNCPPNITFTDNPRNLNGLSNLTRIEGSLHLFQTYFLEDLQGLQNLESIGGDLIIELSNTLVDLRGLENLRAIGGDLIIHNNNNFKGIEGLDNLTSLGGRINFYENPQQTRFGIESLTTIGGGLRFNELDSLNFAGFENLTEIGGSLIVSNCPYVRNFSGLDQLETIGLDLWIDDNFSLEDFTGLGQLQSINRDFVVQNHRRDLSLSGLGQLTTIGRDLKIIDNDVIENLLGLEGVTQVNRDLVIDNNPVTSLMGLQNLVSVEEEFLLKGNWLLTSLNGLEGLERVYDFTIERNTRLDNLTGLDQLHSIEHNLTLENNGFTSLTGLGASLAVDNSIFIRENSDLSDLRGLESIASVGRSIAVWQNGIDSLNGIAHLLNNNVWLDLVENSGLRDLRGLETVDSLDLLQLKENRNLISLNGLNNLKSSGGIVIDRNRELRSLTGLEALNRVGTFFLGNIVTFGATGNNIEDITALSNLRTVTGSFKIERNPVLLNLKGLEGIDSIGGDFSIIENPLLDSIQGLANLEVINGGVEIIDNSNLLSLEGLGQLHTINGNVEITGNSKIETFEYLANLEQIKGDLIIENSDGLLDLNGLEGLTMISGELTLNENDQLRDIFGIQNVNPDSLTRLVIRRNKKLSNCQLDNICTYINLDNNNTLISSNDDGCRSRKEIYCKDYSISGYVYHDSNQNGRRDSAEIGLENMAITYGAPVPTLTNPEGLFFFEADEDSLYTIMSDPDSNWMQVSLPTSYTLTYAHDDPQNDSLEFGLYPTFISSSCLENGIVFTSQQMIDEFPLRYPWCRIIEGDVEIDEALDSTIFSLQPLSQLEKINGELVIVTNSGLENLDGLNQLDTIKGRLDIFRNDQLKNLNGLESLKVIGSRLSITNNDQLISIVGIRNIAAETIDNPFTGAIDLTIQNNPLLSFCNLENLCQLSLNPDKTLQIGSNAPGCNDVSEWICKDLRLAGTTYFDFNQNKVKDANESGISNFVVNIDPPGENTFSDQNGFYYAFADSGIVYTIAPPASPDWNLTTDSTTYTVKMEPNLLSNLEKDFGFYPTFSKHEGAVNITANNLRCDTPVDFFLRIQNTGTFQENGEIRFIYDSLCTFESATPFPDQVDEDNYLLIWNYDQYPFQHEDFAIELNIPDFNSLGDYLNFTAEMYRDSANNSILLDDYHYSDIVICSYDPNDKLVNPPGVQDENYTLRGETLYYTVRFQNTGNAEAIDVRIVDTLDTRLDLSTFKVINSSHSVRTTLEGHELTFLFRNIYLPDSTSNPEGSQGFISYEIKQFDNNPDFTEINNTAHIIFDSNPAIVTNTTKNTMVEMIPIIVGTSEITAHSIYIRPNPAYDLIELYTPQYAPIENVRIYNLSGQLMQQAQQKEINISSLPGGLYLLEAEVNGQVLVGKFVKY